MGGLVSALVFKNGKDKEEDIKSDYKSLLDIPATTIDGI
jgi:hypothetical protein